MKGKTDYLIGAGNTFTKYDKDGNCFILISEKALLANVTKCVLFDFFNEIKYNQMTGFMDSCTIFLCAQQDNSYF